MYPYHNRIRQRIKNHELVDYYHCEHYPQIGEALVLVFNTPPFLRPVRPARIPEYMEILKGGERGYETK